MDFTAAQSPLQLIANALPGLSGAKLRVAEVIVANPTRVAHEPITWLAAEATTTPATVTRLAAGLGFAGYPALRAAIATDNGREAQVGWEHDIGLELTPEDDAEQVLNVLARNQFAAMRNSLATVDYAAITTLAEKIASAPHVHVFGSWGDSIPARELQTRLTRIGVAAWLHDGESALRFGSRLLAEDDVVIVFSRIGDNDDALQFIERARRNGATTAVITGAPKSRLGKAGGTTLYTGTPAGSYWTDYFAGRTSDVLIASLLWVLVAQRIPNALTGTEPPAS
jgi:DNA-binding MurR/RpiR family transcriptional regulator